MSVESLRGTATAKYGLNSEYKKRDLKLRKTENGGHQLLEKIVEVEDDIDL